MWLQGRKETASVAHVLIDFVGHVGQSRIRAITFADGSEMFWPRTVVHPERPIDCIDQRPDEGKRTAVKPSQLEQGQNGPMMLNDEREESHHNGLLIGIGQESLRYGLKDELCASSRPQQSVPGLRCRFSLGMKASQTPYSFVPDRCFRVAGWTLVNPFQLRLPPRPPQSRRSLPLGEEVLRRCRVRRAIQAGDAQSPQLEWLSTDQRSEGQDIGRA